MTILITGGTGFLGSYLTRYALTSGGQERVVVLDRYIEKGRIADLLDHVTLIEGDVADPATVEAAVADHGVRRVAHFAFILGSPAVGQMLPYVRVQTLGTATVLEAARKHGVERVLFASSVAAYGEQEAEVLTEDLVPAPVVPYGDSKVWGEALARHYADNLGLDTVSVRFGSTYGLGRAARGSYRSGMLRVSDAVHYMARVEDAVRGAPIVMPRGDAMADWTYAADAAKAAWLALTAPQLPHRLYNVGAQRAPIGEFTDALRRLLPGAQITSSETEAPGNAHKPMDSSRLRRDLGYAPDFSLEAGLADYIDRIRIFDRYATAATGQE